MKFNKSFFEFLNLQFLYILFTIGLGKFIALEFDPNYFGEFSLVTGLLSLFSLFLLTPTIQSYRTSYFKSDIRELNSIYLSLITGFILTVCVLSPIFLFLLDSLTLILLCLILYSIQAYYALFSANINLLGRNNLYTFIQLFIPLGTFLALLLLNSYLNNKLEVLIIATIIGNLISLLFSLYFSKIKIIRISLGEVLNSNCTRELITYIKPILFLPLFSWLVNSGDKYLIKFFMDDYSVGLYSASYSIGSRIFLSLSGILMLWLNSSVFQSVAFEKEITAELYQKTMKRIKNYFLTGIIIIGLVQLFSNQIGLILLSEKYSSGFYLIGILGFSQLLLTSFQFLEQLVYAEGTTKYILYHYILGGILNISLNIVLIPVLGILGAAISMIVSAATQFIFLNWLIFNKIKTVF